MPNRQVPVMVRRWELVAAFLAITLAFIVGLWRLQTSLDATRRAIRTNHDQLAILCDQSFITAAVMQQTVILLRSEPVTRARSQTIGIFQGYLQLLGQRPECSSTVLPPPLTTTTTTPSVTTTTPGTTRTTTTP